jgi:hypothetical protein
VITWRQQQTEGNEVRSQITDNSLTLLDTTNSTKGIQRQLYARLLEKLGGTYASSLGIRLTSVESDEVFKWFLASLLLGTRISEGIAIKTYREFEKVGAILPEAISETGRLGLIGILDRGGYRRYDFKTATKLLLVVEVLKERYKADLNRLHFFATDGSDLEKKLQGLGKGVGAVTVAIFLRELRDLWEKAEPALSELALLSSRKLRLIQTTDAGSSLEQLKATWEADELRQCRFSDFEAALIRLGKNYCRKKRCSLCPVKEECQDMK